MVFTNLTIHHCFYFQKSLSLSVNAYLSIGGSSRIMVVYTPMVSTSLMRWLSIPPTTTLTHWEYFLSRKVSASVWFQNQDLLMRGTLAPGLYYIMESSAVYVCYMTVCTVLNNPSPAQFAYKLTTVLVSLRINDGWWVMNQQTSPSLLQHQESTFVYRSLPHCHSHKN